MRIYSYPTWVSIYRDVWDFFCQLEDYVPFLYKSFWMTTPKCTKYKGNILHQDTPVTPHPSPQCSDPPQPPPSSPCRDRNPLQSPAIYPLAVCSMEYSQNSKEGPVQLYSVSSSARTCTIPWQALSLIYHPRGGCIAGGRGLEKKALLQIIKLNIPRLILQRSLVPIHKNVSHIFVFE